MKKYILLFCISNNLFADSLSPISIDYCLNKSELPSDVKIYQTKNFDHLLNIESELPITFQYNGKTNSRIPKTFQPNHFPYLILSNNFRYKKDELELIEMVRSEILIDKSKIVQKPGTNLLDIAIPNINIFQMYLNRFDEKSFTSPFKLPIAYYKNDQFFKNSIIIEKTNGNIYLKFEKPNDLFELTYNGDPKEENLIKILVTSELILKIEATISFVKIFEKTSIEHTAFLNNQFTLNVNKKTCSGINISSDRPYTPDDINDFKNNTKDLKAETINEIIKVINLKQIKIPIFNQEVFSGNGIEEIPCATFGKMIKKSFESINSNNLFSMSYESDLIIPEPEKASLIYKYNNKESKLTIYKRYRKSSNSIDMRDSDCGIKCPKNIANKKRNSKYQSVIGPNEKLDPNLLVCFSL